MNPQTVEAKELKSDQNASRDEESRNLPTSYEILHASLFGEVPDKVMPK